MGRESRRWPLLLLLALLIGGGAWLLPRLLRSAGDAAPASAPTSAAAASEPHFEGTTDAPASVPLPAPSGDAAATRPTSLHVVVTWERDGTPAAGVGLELIFWAPFLGGGQSVRDVLTDAHGEWLGADVPAGKLSLSFDRFSNGVRATLVAGEANELRASIPAGILLRGLVTDAAGVPEPGAQIVLGSTTTEEALHVVGTAGADGRFELRDVATEHRVGARSARHAPSCMYDIKGKEGDVVDVILVLGGPCGALHGLVLSPDGTPVGGAEVNLGGRFGFGPMPEQDRGPGRSLPAPFDLVTAPDGSFLAEGVPAPRRVEVSASTPGLSPAQLNVLIEPDKVAEATLTLAKLIRVSGTVRDGAGRPVDQAQVVAGLPSPYDRGSPEPDSSRPVGFNRFTGPDGRFEFSGLLPGSCKLLASKDGVGREAKRLELEPGQDLTWDPVLAAGVSIAGRLLDAQGAPAPGWLLTAVPQPDQGEARRVRSGRDGRFEISNVGRGPQQIRVLGRDLGNAEVILADGVEPGVKDLVLHLPEGLGLNGRITGRLVDPEGRPLAGAHVTLSSEAQHGYPTSFDETSGQFIAEQLPPGSWHVDVSGKTLATQQFGPFALAGGAALDVGTLVLQIGGTLAVTVRTPAGAAPGDVSVATVSGPSGALLARDGDTWRSRPLLPGAYVVQIDSHEFVRARRDVFVESGRESELTVDLVAGVRQDMDLFVSSALSPDEAVPLSIVVRSLAGEIAWDMGQGHLPAWSGPPQPADVPTITLHCVLPAGSYLVDLDAGNKSAHGLQREASAQTAWELRLP